MKQANYHQIQNIINKYIDGLKSIPYSNEYYKLVTEAKCFSAQTLALRYLNTVKSRTHTIYTNGIEINSVSKDVIPPTIQEDLNFWTQLIRLIKREKPEFA